MIIFMGVAGSGKSVQGNLLARDLGYTWLSMGELLRQSVDSKRKQEMLEGKLLNDKEIITMMEGFLGAQEDTKACILDGFPRTLPQADWLLGQHEKGVVTLDAVIHLQASREVVKRRLLSRGRLDDNEQAIDKRFAEYEQATLPIVTSFKEKNISVIEIDGEDDIDTTHRKILKSIKEL